MVGVEGELWCGQLRERYHLGDLGVDGKIILNCMRRNELD